jgi:hypothetical protein
MGAGTVFVLWPSRSSGNWHTPSALRRSDMELLGADFESVGQDLRVAMGKMDYEIEAKTLHASPASAACR